MMYAVDWNYIPRYPKWIQWYSSVYRLSPGMWWFHFGHRDIRGLKLYFPLSPGMWWFHFGHRDIRGLKLYFPLSSIVSRDMMMNYYIPWKSLTGAYHDVHRGLKLYTTIFKVNTMIFICLPNVSRDVMNYYIPWKSDSCIPWCTPWIENYTPLSSIVSRDMMMNSLWSSRYPWIEVIFPLSSIVSRDVMMNYYIPWKSDSCIPWCTPWIENYIFFHCLPIVSRDMMISLWSLRYSWIENYFSIVYRLSPEMWWWIITSLEKVWQLQTMMYAVDWKLYTPRYPKWLQWYTSVYRLSPEIWWFHFGHCDIRGLKIIFPLSTDCLQRCDDELLHSLKKSDWCIPWCTPWIENYIHHDIQSEYNGTHLSTNCLQRCTYSGNHGCHDVHRGLKLYSIVCRLSPEMYIFW